MPRCGVGCPWTARLSDIIEEYMEQEIEQERRAAVTPGEGSIPTYLVDALAEGRAQDPFSLLGLHMVGRKMQIRTWQPGAHRVQAVGLRGGLLAELQKVD